MFHAYIEVDQIIRKTKRLVRAGTLGYLHSIDIQSNKLL